MKVMLIYHMMNGNLIFNFLKFFYSLNSHGTDKQKITKTCKFGVKSRNRGEVMGAISNPCCETDNNNTGTIVVANADGQDRADVRTVEALS